MRGAFKACVCVRARSLYVCENEICRRINAKAALFKQHLHKCFINTIDSCRVCKIQNIATFPQCQSFFFRLKIFSLRNSISFSDIKEAWMESVWHFVPERTATHKHTFTPCVCLMSQFSCFLIRWMNTAERKRMRKREWESKKKLAKSII